MRKSESIGRWVGCLAVALLLGCSSGSNSGGGSSNGDAATGEVCVPACEGKVCGDDGCGNVCGTCPSGESCVGGVQCVCNASCEGKQCGDDGCGGSCGTCSEADTACNEAGQCACAPQCEGKQCGDDACGGQCGDCGAQSICTEENECLCQPDCTDKACGDDGCGGSCGDCPQIAPYCVSGTCKPTDCTPDCTSKVCGDDGCGGVCGSCEEDVACVNGVCDPSCSPQCAGKDCGADGCGGVCGTCSGDTPYCVQGVCEPPCVPDCDGKDCGSDGCGSVCGTCPVTSPQCVLGTCKTSCSDCFVSGTVFAPEGTIPISGALVYLSPTKPDPIPQSVFCDECVQLQFGTPFDFSNAQGQFEFPVQSEGSWYLVVQKGTFRRVRTIEIVSGGQVIPTSMTTLPSETNVALGDDIPQMAVIVETFDNIENTLAKLGLGETDSIGYLETGTESFDVFDSWDIDLSDFFSQWENLAQYHIIFFPCDSDWFNPTLQSPAIQAVLRQYVEAGGKLYVTDWSNDILKQVFPEPVSWEDDDGSPNSADLGYSYEAPAKVSDSGLADWIYGQGISEFELVGNWSIIASTNSYTAPDVSGEMTEMEPKVWVKAQVPDYGLRPATVSFQYGCGRGLFSTYHTEGESGKELMPQELALAYIVFEVGICTQQKANP